NIVANEGKIAFKKLVYTVAIGAGDPVVFSDFKFYRGSSEITAVGIVDDNGDDLTVSGGGTLVVGDTSVIVTINDEEEIAASDDNTYHLKATIGSVADDDEFTIEIAEDTTKSIFGASTFGLVGARIIEVVDTTDTNKAYVLDVNGDTVVTAATHNATDDVVLAEYTAAGAIVNPETAPADGDAWTITAITTTATPNFIWSDQSAGTSHDTTTADWMNGYMVDDFPTTKTFMTE
ncbi:MAG: hypothetical protein U9N04_02870, partial [Patescibacteria group bacterium]|nr:hypothetical protein [Patescibacteria group bacterium]